MDRIRKRMGSWHFWICDPTKVASMAKQASQPSRIVKQRFSDRNVRLSLHKSTPSILYKWRCFYTLGSPYSFGKWTTEEVASCPEHHWTNLKIFKGGSCCGGGAGALLGWPLEAKPHCASLSGVGGQVSESPRAIVIKENAMKED